MTNVDGPNVSHGPAGARSALRPINSADWMALHSAARDALRVAYAPYSRYLVGAAALVDDGRVVSGCNIENASYGLTLCAECALVVDLVRGGGGTLRAMVCLQADATPVAPCGRCRQVLHEFAAPDALIDTPNGPIPFSDLLPWSFGPNDLVAAASPSASLPPHPTTPEGALS